MADILMICVRRDLARAEALARMLGAAGFSIADLPASDTSLRSSGAAILVWSHASVRSASFRDASRRVIRTGKGLIASLIASARRPTRIGCSPIFDLSDWNGDPGDAVLDPLFRTADRMVAELRTQTEHWRAIRDSREVAYFVDYLARYGPDGAFSEAAERRLVEVADRAVATGRAGPSPEPSSVEPNRRTAPARPEASATCSTQKRSAAHAAQTIAEEPKRRCTGAPTPVAPPADHVRRSEHASLHTRMALSPTSLGSPLSAVSKKRAASSPSSRNDADSGRYAESALRRENAVARTALSEAPVADDRQRDTGAKPACSPVATLLRNSRRKRSSEQKSPAAATNVPRVAQPPEGGKLSSPASSGAPSAPVAPIAWSRRKRTARAAVMVAPAIVGVALAGALLFSGVGESNAVRPEADMGIPVAQSGVDYLDELESPDPSATQPSPAPFAAARREGRRKSDAVSLSESGSASLAATNARGSSAAFAPLQGTTSAPAEAPPSGAHVATDALGFDIGPEVAQGSDADPAEDAAGLASPIHNPRGAPLPGPFAVDKASLPAAQDGAAPPALRQ